MNKFLENLKYDIKVFKSKRRVDNHIMYHNDIISSITGLHTPLSRKQIVENNSLIQMATKHIEALEDLSEKMHNRTISIEEAILQTNELVVDIVDIFNEDSYDECEY